ncbi:hypothetical protein [Paenibacillus abyssi]|uniref:Prenyltransferase n=1 Tax=Paenibacillus abyssi TaxID=1340531 RepID=A0A917LDU4_9BACL|nr:hypothetical protein [Paenibacillus abyssi]GGG15221.1 hypothetical protein GCM10010916_35170 [Paenibacillus abyssi]
MTKLSAKQYEEAKSFMMGEARAIDKYMFLYEFEKGDPEDVIKELAKYQNADGGFGWGLEPDLRCKESSVLASTVALQYLSKLETESKNELIKPCFTYLTDTYNETYKGWAIIPKEAVQSPRAIWWEYTAASPAWGNPNAEVLGCFYEYPELVDSQFKEKLTDESIQYLLEESKLSDMHELLCYVRLYERLPAELQAIIKPRLDRYVDNVVIKNPKDRHGYCAVPLQVADSPASVYYQHFADVLPADLAQLIDSQTDAGSWEPNWSWGRYEEEWVEAKKEWEGYLTLGNLRILKAYQAIETNI